MTLKSRRPTKKLDKSECQKLHLIKRFRTRLGIFLTEDQYYEIISCIKNNTQHELFKIRLVGQQSLRLKIYQITIPTKEPMNIIYDCKRGSLVTVVDEKEGIQIFHFYDVFNNKLQVKDYYGYGGWIIKDGMLNIPNEDVISVNGYFEVVSDGMMKNKRFKYDNNDLIEIM